MFYHWFKNTVFLSLLMIFSCKGIPQSQKPASYERNQATSIKNDTGIIVGANRISEYEKLLKGKKIGFVGNQTSVIFKEKGYTHAIDSLLALGIKITKVFSPEHGFRGEASAGELIQNEKDSQTGLPVISLYGSHKKPTPSDLENIDLLIFDIQDVGLRFYTYISTLHYVMEAAAENNIPVVVFDRPNPNGASVDGPILEKKHQSFVGMHPVPILHGMTIGEYAQMINGEKWLANGVQVDLTIVKMKNYTKQKSYSLPIKPSPNLPNDHAVNLYASLCFFEGTNVNAGRGTAMPFEVFGSPFLNQQHFTFSYVPKSNRGAKHPKHENEICYGMDLRNTPPQNGINLDWLIDAYQHTSSKKDFFIPFFEKLSGTDLLRAQITAGKNADEIKASWQKGIRQYNEMRAPYLLYPL